MDTYRKSQSKNGSQLQNYKTIDARQSAVVKASKYDWNSS